MTTAKKIEVPNVVEIGAIRGCDLSAFKTVDGKAYFWGFAYGSLMTDPVVTEFSSLNDLFASLDSPMMLNPVMLDLKQQVVVEKLARSFDDTVKFFPMR